MQTSSSKTKNHFHSIKAILQDMMLYTKSKESFFYTIFFFFFTSCFFVFGTARHGDKNGENSHGGWVSNQMT